MSGTRATDGNYTVGGGHRLFCGRDEFIYAGVAILVHARWASSIIRFHKISDKLVFVDLLLHGSKYKVIAIYVPQHRGWRGDTFEEVLSELAVEVCNRSDSLILEERWTFRSV